jgi:hypothetical protein
MKNYVGARSVRCNCIYCKPCLVQKEVLWRYGTEISPRMARKDNLVCVSCGQLLVQDKADKTTKIKQ